MCRHWAAELAGARGASPRDQAKIDATLEAMIRTGCMSRAEAARRVGV